MSLNSGSANERQFHFKSGLRWLQDVVVQQTGSATIWRHDHPAAA